MHRGFDRFSVGQCTDATGNRTLIRLVAAALLPRRSAAAALHLSFPRHHHARSQHHAGRYERNSNMQHSAEMTVRLSTGRLVGG